MEFLQEETRAIGALCVQDEKSIQNNSGKQISKLELNDLKNTNIKLSDNQEVFSQLPARDPLDLQFKNLSYTVEYGFKRVSKTILHSVSGKFPAGQMTAIMGPSGAGKSTLLNVLSGFKTTGVDGSILMNGRRRVLAAFRKNSCYITQDDRLQVLLTVGENMRSAADLKLGRNVEYEAKERIIEEILILLNLYDHEDTLAQKLSGGQKKRLSIALEMINNPTVMFLDEPTTGLDSHSCNKVIELLKKLAAQGRTIICTIHQPTAKIFSEFDQVYVLSSGKCLYQGGATNLVPFLQSVHIPCPKYHNPADFIIELACEEHGLDKIDILCNEMENGNSTDWFKDPSLILDPETLMRQNPIKKRTENSLEETSFWNQLIVLTKRGFLKSKRDTTLTHLRIAVNVFLGIVLGLLYTNAGNEGSRVLDNYNLLFAILIHHSMTTMMLTVLTFPMELTILIKEHFNRWYSLKAYYASVTILDLPISIFCCLIFTVIIYFLSSQPLEWFRFGMFFAISILIVFVGQSIGLMIGGWFSVVNGTFFAPVLNIPMMMFAGFGVTLRDLPSYLKWGSHISYLRYGLEGYVGAIYGEKRKILDCEMATYCHYRYPQKFLSEITMRGDQFWTDVCALVGIIILMRTVAYFILKCKIRSVK